MNEALTIRPMVDTDLPGVLETLRAALGETPLLRRTPELWAWKHQHNPFGSSIVLVAVDGRRIAGVRALMRWRLALPDRGELSCVRPVDTAVHPDYQRRGIFSALNHAAVELARDEGVDLVFNTPNQQSRPGYLKAGWRDVGPVGVMLRPTLRVMSRDSEGALPEPDTVLPGSQPAIGPYELDRAPCGLRTMRSEGYMKWRFEQHPTAAYVRLDEAGSTVILRINKRNGRNEVVVSELSGEAGNRAIATAIRSSVSGYFIAWFSPGSPERRQAMRAGLIPIPRLKALNLVARPLSQIDVDVLDPGSWDLALSDLELL